MKSYLLGAVALLFCVSAVALAPKATPTKRIPNANSKCFTRAMLKIDHNDNVFIFFKKSAKAATKKCASMKYMPYEYWSVEVYGLNYLGANTIYKKFYHVNPLSINGVFGFLKRNKIICHRRADAKYWPPIAHFNCVTVLKARR